MEKLKKYSDEFKFKFEKFILGCDALEETNSWDKAELGEMDLFYEGDLICVIIRLIAADGRISEKEVEYINDFFGFNYTAEALKRTYEENADDINSIFDEEMQNGISYMKSISEKLAAAYKELLLLVCDIIIESDGIIDTAEVALAEKLKTLAL